METIEITAEAKVFGYKQDNEDLDVARARILLEAEMRGNAGSSRIHLTFAREKSTPPRPPQRRSLCMDVECLDDTPHYSH